jgi:hypothetical protein
MVISQITDLLNASRQVLDVWRHPWWRGQGQIDWKLQPKVHRILAHDIYEANIIAKFMQLAPSRHAQCPGANDHAKWLFLAQHYGLPTRLLDWSESPLVALYFAVANDENDAKSGTLWALDPFGLNFSIKGKPIIASSADPDVVRLVDLAFTHSSEQTKEALAVFPDEVDIRLMVQFAGFTIHGSSQPLEKYAKVRIFLRKFVIPARSKAQLRNELKALGIRQRSIFPDLYNLSQDLARGSL